MMSLLKEKVDSSWDEMIETLQNLIAVDSQAAEPEENSPFGPGVQKAFLYMLEKAEKDGFITVNTDNYGGHIELRAGEYPTEKVMGMMGHLDTVPAGEGWTKDPFGGEIENGNIYGRGALDNKGPTVAAYYAMRAVRDAGLKLNKDVRLILGLDEETDWKGVEYYLSKVKAPDFGFIPDSDFPAINGEKGIATFALVKKFPKSHKGTIEFRSLKGGDAPNMVADKAKLVVLSDSKEVYAHLKKKAEEYSAATGYILKTRGKGKSMEIIASGISSHGAYPQDGLNAISIIMDFISDIEFSNEGINEFIKFYNNHIGFDLGGERLGIAFEDEISGKTIVNVGMITMDMKSVKMDVNVRIPISFDDRKVYDGVGATVSSYNIGILKEKYQPPIYVPEDHPFMKTLMDVYRDITCDNEAVPVVIGGGTYARALKNHFAFGPSFPGEQDMCHKRDEYMNLENLRKATYIYAEAIYRLCGEDKNTDALL